MRNSTTTVVAEYHGQRELVTLSPHVRTSCRLLRSLPTGSVIHTPPKALKAIVAHLNGDENFVYLYHHSPLMLGLARAWILAGQLGLYSVQNRLIQTYLHRYKRARVLRRKYRIEQEAIDYVQAKLGTKRSKIEKFILLWHAGLSAQSLQGRSRSTRYIRSQTRGRILSYATRAHWYRVDLMLCLSDTCMVNIKRGDYMKPPGLDIRTPMPRLESTYYYGTQKTLQFYEDSDYDSEEFYDEDPFHSTSIMSTDLVDTNSITPYRHPGPHYWPCGPNAHMGPVNSLLYGPSVPLGGYNNFEYGWQGNYAQVRYSATFNEHANASGHVFEWEERWDP